MPRTPQADYDSPWKEILQQFFPSFVRFFFPQMYTQIDWDKGYRFQDKEFQKITHDAETGRHTVDKLVKVRLPGGAELWLLIHIEVQSQRDPNFAERMYVYNYRLFDRHRQNLMSIAVLSDENKQWRPAYYERETFGCRVRLDFPSVKLLDYHDRGPELEQHENPFALVVLAHLRAQQTKRAPQQRMAAKLQLIRLLRERGYPKKHIGQLLRFIGC